VLTGLCVVAGWVLHDVVVFLARALPSVAWKLLPGSLVALVLGAAFGALAARRPAWVVTGALVLAAAASVVPRFSDQRFSVAHSWLPRAVFLLLIAFAFAAGLARLKSMNRARAGLALGALTSVAMSAARLDLWDPNWTVLWSALLALAAGFAPWARVRVLLTLAAVGWAGYWTVDRVAADSALRRPDLGPPPVAAAADSPDLVLIVLDTVRAHRLAPYGHERVTMPRLDAFAEEFCTRYTNARSTTSWTLPSHASLFTGLYPAQHGATHPRTKDRDNTHRVAIRPARPLQPEARTIAQVLRERGYRTGAVVANNAYLNYVFGLDRGFEHYDDRRGAFVRQYLALAQLAGHRQRWGATVYRDAEVISDLALDWLDERDHGEPFFLMLNYMDAHAPYLPPAPHHREFGDEQPFDPLDPELDLWPLLYDRSLHYLDVQLDRVFTALKERGSLENTVVIVTSDHGEAFGEHDWWTHAWILYDEVLHVPLYIKPLGAPAAAVDERMIRGVDVFPLAMHLMGFADEPVLSDSGVVGEWYRGETNPGVEATAERTGRNLESDLLAWIEDGHLKFIVGSNGEVAAYDLARDPGEQAPLELSDAERHAAVERARAWWEANPPPEGPEVELDDESLQRLKGLGYTGGEEEEDD
jgi:arylsulfatase A-like enzyme